MTPSAPHRPPSRGSRLWAFQARYAPYLFVAPFVILFCAFMLYPLGRSIVLSFYKVANPRTARFVGLDNYRFLLHDQVFRYAVANTVYFALAFILLEIPLALGLALLLNNPRLRGRNVLRLSFFSPHLVGGVFVAVIFSLLLTPRQGLVNRAIGAAVPHVGTEINWTGKPLLAMPAIVMAALWLSVGYAMIYLLAALQSVDQELYEAADVDGAGRWQKFRHVTLPGIEPVLRFLLLVGLIGAFQLFELPYVLFGQSAGPAGFGITIVMYLFFTGFRLGDLGYASAVGWALVLILLFVSLLQARRLRSSDEEAT
jgi:ABC-type sugar transport system permease subunit